MTSPTPAFLPPNPSPRRDAGVRWLEGFPIVFAWGLRRGFAGGRFRWVAGCVVGVGALLGLLVSQDTSAIEAPHACRAPGGGQDAVQHADGRRLARAVVAEEAKDLARLHVE